MQKDLQTIETNAKSNGNNIRCIIGLGGGQAIDVAKYFNWLLGSSVPLFQIPTALTVDAPWGHRAAIRYDGVVRYVGFAIPKAVYIDYGIVQNAPKRLNLSGVGFRASLKGEQLVLLLGFSHEVKYTIPKGIAVKVEKQTKLNITGSDKELVSKVSADIKSLKPVEPYKAKGIKERGQFVLRKEGKKK